MKLISVLGLILPICVYSQSLPRQPQEVDHPSSATYDFQLKKESYEQEGRKVDVYLPVSKTREIGSYPVVVFGHGQAIDVSGYDLTFQHLAKKGIAVVHPMYDNGFFDQKWRRMADDFNSLTLGALKKYPQLNPKLLIYAGHSKGGYVALMAAGAPSHLKLDFIAQSLVLFAPAGYDAEYLKNINSQVPVTLVYSDNDKIIKRSILNEIESGLSTKYKQFIEVTSYPGLKADHFHPLSKSFLFGGSDGISSFHYYATWKFLVAASLDVQSSSPLRNPYIYGAEALTTGIEGLQHKLLRKSW